MSADDPQTQRIETARKEIEATRSEVNVRLQQRDSALFAYLTAAGVIGGFAFSATPKTDSLLMIPFLSVAVGAIVSQHHTVIGRREAFIATHLMPFLKAHGADSPFKEGVLKGEHYFTRDITIRTIAHFIALLLPAGLSLAATNELIDHPDKSAFWWAALTCTLTTFGFVCQSHTSRCASASATERASR